MVFPLKQRKLIRGCQAHISAGLSCAADYVAKNGTEYYAPFDGTLSIPYPYTKTSQGGIWLRLTKADGTKIEIAHLQKYVKSSGSVKEGELVAYTDNTGTVTTGPHAHIQIIKDGKRLDPETYNWGNQPIQQGKSMYEKGVTLQMLSNVAMRDVPSDIGKQTGTLQTSDLCEVVEHTADWLWYSINAANVKFGWIKNESNFKAVPRSTPPPSDSDQKLAQAKDLAKVIQATSSKQLAL